MDELTVDEFREALERLTEPVIVTIDGKAIGTWSPVARQRVGSTERRSEQVTRRPRA